MEQQGTTVRTRAAWLVVAALLSGCAAEVRASTEPVGGPEVAHEIVQWNDGLDHLVVTFAAAPVAVASGGPVPMPASEESLPPPLDDDTVLVVRDGGSIRREVRDGSLRLVVDLSDVERAAVAAAGDEALAVVVEDPDGAVGPRGDHYLMTPGRLELVTAAPAATASAPVSEPSPEQRPGAPVDTEARQEALLDVPGVVSAEPVTADTFAVATSGDRAAIVAVPGVESVAADVVFGLADDPGQPLQWWLENTGAKDAGGTVGVIGADANARVGWRVSRGAGVVVAVIDTGVDGVHPDLSARMWANSDEVCRNGVDDDRNGYVDDCTGWDFGNNDNGTTPDATVTGSNHGTHVAGIVAATANGVGGVGLAPEATIMPLKVMDSMGLISMSMLYGSLVYAADNGAQVVNMSLATGLNVPRSSVTVLEDGIAYARSKGVTVVVAAGNAGADVTNQPLWPASYSSFYDNVITVGATTNRDTRASFSNYGAPVTIYAPGQYIYSTLPNAVWGYMSGTSMASPVVAGAVADLLASPLSSSPGGVRARLVGTARATGAGPRLDLGRALGGDDTRTVKATYEGADALVPEQVGTLGVRLQATQVPAGVAGVRMHLAALVGGQVYAVTALPAVVSTPSGSTPVTSGADGAFPAVPLPDTAPLSSAAGLRFDIALELPAGDFAVVTELVDTGGAVVGGTSVGYLTVAAPAPDPGPTTTSVGASPTSTTAAGPTTTTVGAGPTTTAARATTTTSAPGGSGTTAPATTAPGTTAPGSGPTTTSASGGTGTTLPSTSLPATTSPATTSPATTSPATTSPATTSPATTSPATTSPATTSPVTTSPVTTSPATTSPATTTPPPDPDTSGPWRVDSMSPRLATIDGGTTVVLNGVFPTTVPVFVWFGDLGIVQAVSTGTTLTAETPAVAAPAVTDVTVRFRTSTSHTLTLADAFTFIARSPSTGTTTTSVATTAAPTTAAPTTSAGATTTTARSGSGSGTTSPVTTSPATTSPATTSPATTSPSTTAPVTSALSSTTTLAPPPTLGSLTLRAAPSTGSLSRVSASMWPTGCRTASCSSTSL